MEVSSTDGPLGTPAGAAAGIANPAVEAALGVGPARPPARAVRRGMATGRPGTRSSRVLAAAPLGITAQEADLSAGPPPDGAAEAPAAAPPDTPTRNGSSADPLHRGPAVVADRITVALVARAATDLLCTHSRTGLSKTDIVNRALSLYEFIDAELGDGAELIVRRDGHDNLVKLL